MTPTATYIAEENCLQELPTMKKPELWEYFDEAVYQDESTFRDDDFKKAIREYKAHLASLRKIPCDTSCKGLWADGQKVVDGKDYEVRFVQCPECWLLIESFNCPECKHVAFPLVPVKSEDELWREVMRRIFSLEGDDESLYILTSLKIKELKSKFTITPKQ